MKAIMVMFDSLNRHMLPPYGAQGIHAPNFERLAERSVTFDNYYIGSMPCMPARRELHTGRYNFLHRSWGPIEPFDDSMPEILKNAGVHTHLVSDHYHYWEDGGATYHNRYSTWEFSRGQEGDPWKGDVADPEMPADELSGRSGEKWRQDWVNRKYIREPEEWPQAKTFASALEFITTNASQDNWFLHIETFDPHEPYYVPEKYRKLYPDDWKGPHFDWPPYNRVKEGEEAVRHIRCTNAALISMCDDYLGRVLDLMDRFDMWKDTMLIVNTDHGFLLGEHDWWGKCRMPFYNEVALSPLFIWDPRSARKGARCRQLVQTIDLAPTLLEYFGAAVPPDMQGKPLHETIAKDAPVREAGLFGLLGAHVNVTDGRYVYMRAPASQDNAPLYNYTLMPTHMRHIFTVDELRNAKLARPFSFTKGLKVLKVPATSWLDKHEYRTMLFDINDDPKQERPLEDARAEKRMIKLLKRAMKESDAPPEQFKRLGL